MVGFLCHFMPVCQAGSGYFPGPVHLEAEVRFLGRESALGVCVVLWKERGFGIFSCFSLQMARRVWV